MNALEDQAQKRAAAWSSEGFADTEVKRLYTRRVDSAFQNFVSKRMQKQPVLSRLESAAFAGSVLAKRGIGVAGPLEMKTKKTLTETQLPPLRTGPLIVDGKFESQRREASSMANQRSHFGAPMDCLRSQAQKEMRRGNAKPALLALMEIADFGFRQYAAKVPLICAVEDCAGAQVSVEVNAVYENAKAATDNFSEAKKQWLPLFLAKMVLCVCDAPKSWRSHHLAMWANLQSKLVMSGKVEPHRIPGYALDGHTSYGRRFMQAGLEAFWGEYQALSPAPVAEDDEFYVDVHLNNEAL